MLNCRYTVLIMLAVGFVLLLAACSGDGSDNQADGDQSPDGDQTIVDGDLDEVPVDGDQELDPGDGDTPADGDNDVIIDGDTDPDPDIDPVDGDLLTDGDIVPDGDTEAESITSDDVEEATSAVDQANTILEEELADGTQEEAVEATVDYLDEQEGVSDVATDGENGAIFFTKDGIRCAIYLDTMLTESETRNSGKSRSFNGCNGSAGNAAVYAPLASSPGFLDSHETIGQHLCDAGFSVEMFADAEVTPNAIARFDEFDVIYIRAHGALDNGRFNFMTGMTTDMEFLGEYLQLGKLGIGTTAGSGQTYYIVYPEFFADANFTNDSLAYFSSCRGLQTTTLASALVARGLGVYFGWNNLVESDDEDLYTNIPLFDRLLQGASVGAAMTELDTNAMFGDTYGQTANGEVHAVLNYYPHSSAGLRITATGCDSDEECDPSLACFLHQCVTPCNGHGSDNSEGCLCNRGYTGDECGSCAYGYEGYPDCSDCDLVPAENECMGDILHYCDGQYTQTVNCTGLGQTCGWNAQVGAYACLEETVDGDLDTDQDPTDGDTVDEDTSDGDVTDGDIIDLCGNGQPDPGETCELGDTVACTSLGEQYIDGAAICNATCDGWMQSNCEIEFPDNFCDYNICFPVPPTNQTICYSISSVIDCPGTAGSATCGSTDFCGQDAQYSDNVRSYTCYNTNGTEQNPCDGTADVDEMVGDSLTGLMWQRTWTSDKAWQSALDYCSGLTYGGYSDWRLPNPHELQSIVDDGRFSPSINLTAFPGTPSSFFWSSTTDICQTDDAWIVDFDGGWVIFSGKGMFNNVRCVRDGQ